MLNLIQPNQLRLKVSCIINWTSKQLWLSEGNENAKHIISWSK